MKLALLAAAVFGGLIAMAQPASAAGMMFGTDENIRTLVDVGVKGENNEDLMLGYKTSTEAFILPYTIKDDGYVLVVKSDHDKYYHIPPDMLERWQKAGLLPDPLPPYQISAADQFFGHILWPALVVIAVLYAVGYLRKRKAAPAGGAPAPVDKGPIS
jgi:hypothetical protein